MERSPVQLCLRKFTIVLDHLPVRAPGDAAVHQASAADGNEFGNQPVGTVRQGSGQFTADDNQPAPRHLRSGYGNGAPCRAVTTRPASGQQQLRPLLTRQRQLPQDRARPMTRQAGR